MENKYYTPTIEEFHIGFEFEFYDDDDGDWNKTEIESQSDLCNFTALQIEKRVKLLDKEDIESLGWKQQYSSWDRETLERTLIIMSCNPIFSNSIHFEIENNEHDIFSLKFNDDTLKIHHTVKKPVKFLYKNEIFSKEEMSTEIIFNGKIKNKSELQKLLIQLKIK